MRNVVNKILWVIVISLLCLSCKTIKSRYDYQEYVYFKPVVNDTIGNKSNIIGSVYMRSKEFTPDSVTLAIHNETPDTLYLFDSYINKKYGLSLMRSKLLHRYDYNTGQYKFSLLPLFQFLGWNQNDLVIIGERGLSVPRCILYSTREIIPYSSIDITISREDIIGTEYIEEINPYIYSIILTWAQLINRDHTPKIIIHTGRPQNTIVVEMAVYRKRLPPFPLGGPECTEADQQLHDYILVSLPLLIAE